MYMHFLLYKEVHVHVVIIEYMSICIYKQHKVHNFRLNLHVHVQVKTKK